uniref:Kazal-like domain-containing protein n=1 Tax=Tetraselmis sp. GSL018 TaxID=582737 RepID=A0A061SA50_9CHLO
MSSFLFSLLFLALLPSSEGRVLRSVRDSTSRVLPDCSCSTAESTFGPVCSVEGKYIAVNTCTAVLCLAWSVIDLVPCNSISGSWQAECNCPDSDTPVCLVSGTPLAPSRCHAECIGPLTDVDYSEDYCRGFGSSAATPVPTAIALKMVDYASLPMKPGCDCLSAIREPVCDEAGVEVAVNRGCARCKMGLAGVRFSEELCPVSQPSQGSGPLSPVRSAQHNSTSGNETMTFFASSADAPNSSEASQGSSTQQTPSPVGTTSPAEQQPSQTPAAVEPLSSPTEAAPEAVGGASSAPNATEPLRTAEYYRSLPRRPDCMCTMVFAPVCDRNGVQVATNAGCAQCIVGLDGVEYSAELCRKSGAEGQLPELEEAGKANPALELQRGSSSAAQFYADLPNVPGCVCAVEFDPVCDQNGVVVAVNSACARCKEGLEGVDYDSKYCPPSFSLERTPAETTAGASAPATPAPAEGDLSPVRTVDFYDSLPVRPGCICMLVFNPVCDRDGVRVAANSGCARCKEGLEDVEYSTEFCGGGALSPAAAQVVGGGELSAESIDKEPLPSVERFANLMDFYSNLPMMQGCTCPEVHNPVCDLGGIQVAANAECARCMMGLEGVTYSESYCIPSSRSGDTYTGNDNVTLADIPMEDGVPCCFPVLEPVCARDGTRLAINAQCAACNKSLAGVEYSKEWCPTSELASLEPSPAPKEECKCPSAWAPVCNRSGVLIATNEECAVCNGAAPGSFDRAWCNPNTLPHLHTQKGPCICPLIYYPYCNDEGEVIVGNSCEAECKNISLAGLSHDNCPAPEPDCQCSGPSRPVCDAHGKKVADSACQARCWGLSAEDYNEGSCTDLEPAGTPAEARLEAEAADGSGQVVGENHWGALEVTGAPDEDECQCSGPSRPVCGAHGKKVADSACQARCWGLSAGDYNEDNCIHPQSYSGSRLEAEAAEDPGDVVGEDFWGSPLGATEEPTMVPGETAGENQWGPTLEGTEEPTPVPSGTLISSNGIDSATTEPQATPEASAEMTGMSPSSQAKESSSPESRDTGDSMPEPQQTPSVTQASMENGTSGDLAETLEGRGISGFSAGPQIPSPPVCICPLIFAPLCDEQGNKVADNTCLAECYGLERGTYSMDWCPQSIKEGESPNRLPSSSPPRSPPPTPSSPQPRPSYRPTAPSTYHSSPASSSAASSGDCGCRDYFEPVCLRDGTQVGENPCKAACKGYRFYHDFHQEWCISTGQVSARSASTSNAQQQPEMRDCRTYDCPDIWDPVCYIDGTFVSANRCYAMCYGHAEQGRELYPCFRTPYNPQLF